MTSEKIAALAGVLLSLVFSYGPGLREKFAELDGVRKRAVFGLALVVVAASATALSCVRIISDVECTQSGVTTLIGSLIAALVASQSAYVFFPPIGGDTLPPEVGAKS